MSRWIDVPSSAELSKEQLSIYSYKLDRNLLINGAAGSGKTILAILRAKQLAERGKRVVLIVFTNMLYQFTKLAAKDFNLGDKVLVCTIQDLAQGVCGQRPFLENINDDLLSRIVSKYKFDHVIVDEGQDFPMRIYQNCFGKMAPSITVCIDKKQSIYDTDFEKSKLLQSFNEMEERKLEFTYRNPVRILRLSIEYYKSRYKYLPTDGIDNIQVYNKQEGVIKLIHTNDEVKSIKEVIENRGQNTVGLLLPRSDAPLYYVNMLRELEIDNVEYYNKRNSSSIDFNNEEPKAMTFWSAKGLQFDTVIVPFMSSSHERNILYSKN